MMAVLLIAFVLLIAPIVLSKIGLESVVEGIATHYLAFSLSRNFASLTL